MNENFVFPDMRRVFPDVKRVFPDVKLVFLRLKLVCNVRKHQMDCNEEEKTNCFQKMEVEPSK